MGADGRRLSYRGAEVGDGFGMTLQWRMISGTTGGGELALRYPDSGHHPLPLSSLYSAPHGHTRLLNASRPYGAWGLLARANWMPKTTLGRGALARARYLSRKTGSAGELMWE